MFYYGRDSILRLGWTTWDHTFLLIIQIGYTHKKTTCTDPLLIHGNSNTQVVFVFFFYHAYSSMTFQSYLKSEKWQQQIPSIPQTKPWSLALPGTGSIHFGWHPQRWWSTIQTPEHVFQNVPKYARKCINHILQYRKCVPKCPNSPNYKTL